jgi:hypothetical protein
MAKGVGELIKDAEVVGKTGKLPKSVARKLASYEEIRRRLEDECGGKSIPEVLVLWAKDFRAWAEADRDPRHATNALACMRAASAYCYRLLRPLDPELVADRKAAEARTEAGGGVILYRLPDNGRMTKAPAKPTKPTVEPDIEW